MPDIVVSDSTQDCVDLLQSSMQENPFSTYNYLRQYRPVCRVEPGKALALSRYRDIVFAFKNPEIFSSVGTEKIFDPTFLSGPEVSGSYAIVLEDEPEHSLHKKLVSMSFTRKAIDRLKENVRKQADILLAAISSGSSVDFISRISYPFVERSIICFLGVNDDEPYPDLCQWSQCIELPPLQPDLNYLEKNKRYKAEISRYCQRLIVLRQDAGNDDFVSCMLASDPDNKVLSHDQKAELIELLLRAGVLPVAQLLTHAVLRLSQEPALLAQIKAEPSKIKSFIDELLRYDSSGHILPRRTLSAVTLSNTLIPKNTDVFLLLAAANRDPDHFDRADTFDISRSNNNTHLSLGYGIHRCMGEILLKTQVTVFLVVLLQRFSTISCPPPEQLDWFYRLASHSFRRLPTRFG